MQSSNVTLLFFRLTFCRLLTYFRNMPLNSESLVKTRGQLGLTQNEFARKLGISRQHLSKLENSPRPLSPKLARRLAEECRGLGATPAGTLSGIRAIQVRSWAQAGIGVDFEELPLDWQMQIATDCPDEQAFAVEIQGDSMEPKYVQGDIAVLMPTHQPRNGSLVVARLEEGVVFKVFTLRDQTSIRICSFTSYNSVFQPIEVPESKVVWNFPVYQIVRQIWR
jgi:SOS-response transcriptional repressor LexA